MAQTGIDRLRALTAQLNRYRYEYYSLNAPTVSDEVYDRLFDELGQLERELGAQLGNSPTQTVGWLAVDINIQTKTTMQIHVDRAYLGKVLGFSTSLSYILIPLSLILGGAAAEVWPSYLLPAISGALLLAALGVLKLW